MTNQAAGKLEVQHPPLARDAHGNLLAIPEGTCAWRICRETTGRPREIRGPDKQPFRFPLDTTNEELVEMCGAGVYRVYALDEVGGQLVDEHIAKWDLTSAARELRNAAEGSLVTTVRPSAPAAGAPTDLRFALEAMTQMMRTNSDALRIVTESHVDLAKAIASAKGLPRNAVLPVSLRPDDDELEDSDDDDATDERPRHFIELLMPLAEKAAELVPALVAGKMLGTGTAPNASAPASPTAEQPQGDDDLAGRPRWEPRDFYDLNYARRKGDAKRAAKDDAAARAAMQARIIADPPLVQQLFAIKNQLAADEIETLMAAVATTGEAEQVKFLDAIKSLPTDEAVAFCRDVINAIRTQSH